LIDPAIFIGIDIGSSSTKAVAVTYDGCIVGQAQKLNVITHPQPGFAEMDVEKYWWGSTLSAIKLLLENPKVKLNEPDFSPISLPSVGCIGSGKRIRRRCHLQTAHQSQNMRAAECTSSLLLRCEPRDGPGLGWFIGFVSRIEKAIVKAIGSALPKLNSIRL
jgi:hypothetical protein